MSRARKTVAKCSWQRALQGIAGNLRDMSRRLSRYVNCAKANTRTCSAQVRVRAMMVAAIVIDDSGKGRPRQIVHELGEQRLAEVHEWLRKKIPKLARIPIRRSNRHHPSSPQTQRQYLSFNKFTSAKPDTTGTRPVFVSVTFPFAIDLVLRDALQLINDTACLTRDRLKLCAEVSAIWKDGRCGACRKGHNIHGLKFPRTI